MRAAIEAKALSKRYGEVMAVNGVDFTVQEGQIVALLGGNGAGKTTTISMLLGLVLPSAGEIRVLGRDMLRERHAVLPFLNFSSPYLDLPHRLTVRENLTVYAHLYGISSVQERIGALARELDIEDFIERPFGQLSAGQKTRVALAKALINRPRLLLLDEPTASLDPDTADWIRTYLRNYQRESGATMLLASHNMLEVERLCQDVLMMKQGRIVDRGSPQTLLTRYGRSTMEEVFLDVARGASRAAE